MSALTSLGRVWRCVPTVRGRVGADAPGGDGGREDGDEKEDVEHDELHDGVCRSRVGRVGVDVVEEFGDVGRVLSCGVSCRLCLSRVR